MPNPPSPDFLPAPAEARVFAEMRRRLVSTVLRQTFSRARFRVSLVVALTGVLWGGIFWMFYDGFLFLRTTNQDVYAATVHGLFGAFLLALMLMLMVSSGIILYGSLFRSCEIGFLLTLPARSERLFLHKFQEAIVLSSWGFLLLASPMLLAYGVVAEAPWYFYALLMPMVIAFIYIPVAIGAMLCLGVVRLVRDNPLAILIGLGILLAAVSAWVGWGLFNGPRNDLLTPAWFQEVLGRLKIADYRLLPSWWLTTGVLDAADSSMLAEATLFLTLLISNALFFRQLALWTAGRVYRAAYSGLYGRTLRRKRARRGRFDQFLGWLLRPLPDPVRLLIVKDLRLFRRDPLQWSQVLIFAGFLVVYFWNIPRFTYNIAAVGTYIGWVNMVSFLNLSVVGLLLSTFTTRFVYPVISLEGRRFWILDLTGVSRQTVLWSKYFFATGGTLLPCATLVLISDLTLKVPVVVLLIHQLTCVVLCSGLAGIAVGLGAWLPNLREESPARIAAGFGGTLTLVVSTLYILIVVLLTAMPTHFYFAAHYAVSLPASPGWQSIQRWLMFWWVAGTVGSLLVGVAATAIPLRIGFKAFSRLEC
ncbi:MAG: hypothetical protein LLG00_15165 [Planctomycetaceae bacterium]|nr:hypothetical protein [Planctomycetaceae bacterium]